MIEQVIVDWRFCRLVTFKNFFFAILSSVMTKAVLVLVVVLVLFYNTY